MRNDSYDARGGRYPPFTVKMQGDVILIDAVYGDSLGLTSGDTLVSVNGVFAATLARYGQSLQSGESSTMRQAFAEGQCYRDLLAFPNTSPFVVEFARESGRGSVRTAGVTRTAYLALVARGRGDVNRLDILPDSMAVLTISDLPSEIRDFEAFLASSFRQVRAAGTRRLILDLRENGGGDSRAGDALLRYLTPMQLPSVVRVDVRVTARIKAYYRTLLPAGFRWIPLHRFVPMLAGIRTTPAGQTFSLNPPPQTPKEWRRRPDSAYEGELYVLIGPRAHSSAAILAAPLKHFGRGTFFGEETGEPLIFYGENYYFDLPNSRLQGVVSHKRFVLVGADSTRPGAGIQPDVRVDPALALRAAVRR